MAMPGMRSIVVEGQDAERLSRIMEIRGDGEGGWLAEIMRSDERVRLIAHEPRGINILDIFEDAKIELSERREHPLHPGREFGSAVTTTLLADDSLTRRHQLWTFVRGTSGFIENIPLREPDAAQARARLRGMARQALPVAYALLRNGPPR